MVKNHVTEYFPKESTTDSAALDAPISVKFDQHIQSVNTAQLFQVSCNSTTITGVTVYDASTRTATFAANGVFSLPAQPSQLRLLPMQLPPKLKFT